MQGQICMCKTFLFYQLFIKLILGKTDSFFLNLRALLEEKLFQCWRKNSWVLRDSKIISHYQHLFLTWEHPCGWIENARLGDLVLGLAKWSLASRFSFLPFSVLWSKLIQQSFLEATMRIFSEPTIMVGIMDPHMNNTWGPTPGKFKVLQWRQPSSLNIVGVVYDIQAHKGRNDSFCLD